MACCSKQAVWLVVCWLICRYCNVSLELTCGQMTSMGFVRGLDLAEKPTFHNVNRSVPKIRSHFIKKQTS